jgi:hypothetical protein
LIALTMLALMPNSRAMDVPDTAGLKRRHHAARAVRIQRRPRWLHGQHPRTQLVADRIGPARAALDRAHGHDRDAVALGDHGVALAGGDGLGDRASLPGGELSALLGTGVALR